MKTLFRESGQNGMHTAAARDITCRPCTGFQKLMRWQIEKYHNAVEEHKRTLSRSRHSVVTWSEAEEAFCEQRCTRLAHQWRSEYCGSICEYRESCPLAELFHHAA